MNDLIYFIFRAHFIYKGVVIIYDTGAVEFQKSLGLKTCPGE